MAGKGIYCQKVLIRLIKPNSARFVTSGVRQISTNAVSSGVWKRAGAAGLLALIGSTSGYLLYRNLKDSGVPSLRVVFAKQGTHEEKDDGEKKTEVQSHRELRVLSFASVEYEGHVYMTPQDFLESIVEDNPRPRTTRRHLRQNEVEKFLKSTPSKGKGSTRLFRGLFDKGVISYTEYLFLLCVLTKPRSGFHIAFNMFDIDGDQRVDKKEFLVLEHLLASGGSTLGSSAEELTELIPFSFSQSVATNADHSNIWKLMQANADHLEESASSLMNNTTLTVYFFGLKGTDVLKYDDFHQFMDNLQSEVLELEFIEFSRGMPTITEEDFARVLLRYTLLTKESHEEYLERLRKRIRDVKGITFKDFKEFCQFLNNLEDFTLAMRIYTYADNPISEADFQRAVKACTGQNLNAHLIHVVFQLFDADGDGRLSHQEFISVMKERVLRGGKPVSHDRWDVFRSCVRSEMKTA